ncbi:MAG: methyltransferase domain-containing protein [Pseudomonadota bacterium]
MNPSARVKAGYDKIARAYAEARNQKSTLPHLEKLNVELTPGSVILDLGCGAGLPVDRWLIEAGHHVIGVDLSDQMLALARENVPKAQYQQGDIAALERGQFAVDAIVCIFALFHTERTKHREILQNMRSFLSTNGHLLITTGQMDWVGAEPFFGAEIWWSHYDGDAYHRMIEESGFEIIASDRHSSDLPKDDWHPIFLARAV